MFNDRRPFLASDQSLADAPVLLGQRWKVDPYVDGILIECEPEIPAVDSFTLIDMPDSQYDRAMYPEIIVNIQIWSNGGDSWLRLLEFKSDLLFSVIDYLPLLAKRSNSQQNRFALTIPPIGSDS